MKHNNTIFVSFLVLLGGIWCLVYSLIKVDVVYLLAGIIFFLCSGVLFIFKKSIKNDVFSPIFVMTCAIILSYGIGCIYLYLNLDTHYNSFVPHQDPSIIFALILIVISIIFVAFGVFVANRTKIVKFPVFSPEISLPKLSLITILATAFGLVIWVVVFKSFGYGNIKAILQNIMQARVKFTMQGMYYIKFLFQFLITAPFFLWVILYFENRDRIRNMLGFKFFLALYFILIIFLGLVSGARSEVLYPLLTCIFIYNYFKKRISVFMIVLFIISILPFVGAYETFRHFSLVEVSSSISISEKIMVSLSNISLERVILRFVTRFNSVFYNFVVLINSWEKTFLYGRSFIDFVLQPIPRIFLPDKPYLFNMAMTKQFYPRFFAMGGGTSFGLVPEAFMNFHFAGIVLFGTVYGLIIGLLQKWYNLNKTNVFFAFIYSQLFLLPWGWLAGGLINSAMNERIILNLFFCTGLYLIISRRRKIYT